jgi:predicted permease
MILDSLEAVFIIFALIGAGVFVAWRKWVSREAAKAFPKIVINLAVPGTVVYSLYSHFTRQQLIEAWLPLLIIFLVMPLTYVVGQVFARLFKIPETRRGVFVVLFSFSNSMFIGFPVAQALFGDSGMPYAVFYFLANTTSFWLLGCYAMKRDADIIKGRQQPFRLREALKKLIQPPILTVFIMFVVIFMEIKLPDVILTTARYIGNLTTPLSLIFIGCMIYDMGFEGMKWEKGIAPVLLGRFVLIPALCFGICMLGIAVLAPQRSSELALMRNVFVIQISLPAMMQTAIVSELYGADSAYATKNVFFTTLASLITIPIYMLLLQAL